MQEVTKRNFGVTYFEKNSNQKIWVVQSHLMDDPHDITVTVEIDMESWTILDASAHFDRCPTEQCPMTEDLMKQLVGLKVDSSFSRNAMRICLGPQGCPNLMTLLLIAVPGIIYYYYPHLIQTGKMTQEEFFSILRKDERNACLAHTLMFQE